MKKTKFKQTEIGMIPEDWNTAPLSKLADVIDPHPSHRAPKIVSEGFPFAGIGDISEDGSIRVDKCRQIGEGFVKQQEKSYTINENSIGYGRVGTVGKVVKLRKQLYRYALSPTLAVIQPLRKKDGKFIHCVVREPSFFSRVTQQMTGTTRPAIGIQLLRKISIPLPSEEEREAIAKVLSDLDSKIELSRRMNKTLEAIGQAIFKHWFVDFEFPNEQGKPYKSSGGAMMESELGEIPKEWDVNQIRNILKTVLGGTPDRTKKEFWDGNIPWINSGKVNEFRIIEPTEYITEKGLNKSATELLPKRTTVIAITGATLGQVSLLEINSCANQSVIGILESDNIKSEYIYFWIKQTIEKIISCQTGGAQQHINKTNVSDSLILIPESKVLGKYILTTKNIFNHITLNCVEELTLAQIRDALLPKLMSGQIRVPRGIE